jgi:ketosteroid isomerase-like protein
MKGLKLVFLICAVILCGLAASSCSKAKEDDVAQIQALEKNLVDAMNAKDVNGIMAAYVSDDSLIAFDCIPPRQYIGANAYRKDFEDMLASFPGPIHNEISDWKIDTEGSLGYGHGFLHSVGTDKDGNTVDFTIRLTDVYRKINGKWLIVHEHASWPVDLTTGKADLTSKL